MAKGYPDYFGQSIWPKYGPIKNDTNNVLIAGLATTILTQITSMGVLCFLRIQISGVFDGLSYVLKMYVDNQIIQESSAGTYGILDTSPASNMPLVCTFKDVLTLVTIVELHRDVPFGSSLKITIDTPGGANLSIDTTVNYYEIL